MQYTQLAQDSFQWKTVVSMIVKLWGSIKAILTSWATVRF